jgi:hypothetical protein
LANDSKGERAESEGKIRGLLRRARLWEVVTFIVVIAVSPISFLFGLPLGISPDTWLASWEHWTFVLILVAIVLALLGFNAASTYRLKADRLRSASQAPTG